VGIVSEYLDGALGADDRARFESHIGRCPGCREYVGQFRKTIAMTGRLTEEDITPSMRDTLLSAFRDWKARPAAES
jgi:anti-sigma factor RsiW